VTTMWPEPFGPDGVRVGADDRTVVLFLAGVDPPSPVESACWSHYEPKATWVDEHLQLVVNFSRNAEPDFSRHELCFPPTSELLTVTLDRPLGTAAVVGGLDPLIVFRARDLLVPTWLPAGWTFAKEHGSQDPAADWWFVFGSPTAEDPPAQLSVITWAGTDPGGFVDASAEPVTVRGTNGLLAFEAAGPEGRWPASATLSWVENGHAHAVVVNASELPADARAICLRVAESLVAPT
jgi:hypothetical protein